MEEETYKPSAFARKIGVHIKTLQRWDKKGIFVAHRAPSNRRYYTQEDYRKYRSGQEKK